MRTFWLLFAASLASASVARGGETPVASPVSAKSPVGSSAEGVANEGRVGDYGDPLCLQFEGMKAFTADAVRDGVFADMNMLLAAHPAALRDEYLAMLRDRVLTGYAHAGFSKATVSVQTDPTHVRLTVHEGSRLLRGRVRVIGAKKIPVDRLVARLTEPHAPADTATDPDADDATGWRASPMADAGSASSSGKDAPKLESPVWEKGKPAPFDRISQESLHDQVQAALADLGFHFSKFTVEVRPRTKQKEGELVVRILNEGPPDTVDEIEVSGHHRDKFQEIVDYLHAQPGIRFDRSQRARIERLLWQSARYAAYKVTPVADSSGEKLKLRIDLTEYPAAPRLNDELSREEKTLLRAREWFVHPDRHQSDLVFSGEVDGLAWEIVVSPKHGCLGMARPAGKPKDDFLWALAATERQVAYYNPAEKRKIVLPCNSHRVYINIELKLVAEALDTQPFRLGFGVGVKPREKDEQGEAVDFKLRAAPAFFVAHAHEYSAACTWKGQRMVLDATHAHIEIDEPTGRVIQYTSLGENRKSGIKLAFVDGALEQRLREIEKVSTPWPNTYDRTRPVGSVVKALWSDSWMWKAYRLVASQNGQYDAQMEEKLREIGRLLLDHGVLEPLDEWIVSTDDKPQSHDEEFMVPGIKGDTHISDWQKLQASLPVLSLKAADALFPRNSWPWTLWREFTLNWSGQSKYFGQELQRLAVSRDKGPVGRLATAKLLRLSGLDGYREVAADGLKHLTAADFRRDVRQILPPDRRSTKVLYRVAEVLRAWDAREIELLTRPLLKERAGLIEEFARQLRSERDKPIADAFDTILDKYWESTLRSETEALLRELVQ